MISFPFNSQNGDRAVDSFVFRNIFKKYFTNGVFSNPSTEFFVQANGGMTVKVRSGYCNINGAIGYETVDRVLQVEASESLDRIDRVVLRLDDNVEQRKIDLYIKKGVASASPTAPTLTRDNTIHELGLADLFIAKTSTSVAQERITDTRLNSTLCGIVTGTVAQLDTSTVYAQIQAQLEQQKNNNQQAFDTWFNTQKLNLDSTVEAQILADIVALESSVASLTTRMTAVETKANTNASNISTLQTGLNTANTNIGNKQNKVLSGTSEPSASLGVNGDIYILLG